MRQTLILHPECVGSSVQRSTSRSRSRSPGILTLWYTVTGDLDALVIPAPVPERRVDELWKSTCFELFLKPLDSSSYLELNFSPSSQWAAYEFAGYREGIGASRAGDVPGHHDRISVRAA